MGNKVEIIISAKDGATRVIKGVGKSLKGVVKVGRLAGKAVGGVLKGIRNLGIAGGATMVGLVKNAADFRKEMAKVSTLTKSSDITQFTSDIIDLSAELGVAKNELARGLYQVLSAGVPEGNAIDFLRKSTKAAIGGVTTTETAVLALTKVLDSYGLKAGDVDLVADKMFTTVKNGVVNFEQLAQGMGQVSGLASKAGISLDEFFGVFATASKTVNPEELFTGLKSTMNAILQPSNELIKVYKKLGMSGEELLKKKGLVGALNAVEKATGGSLEEMGKLIPNVKALPAILAATGNNAAKTEKNVAAMAKSAGASATAFSRIDKVRGWPRLWQQILRPITKIGIIFDKELSPLAKQVGDNIGKWQQSKTFVSFLENVKVAMSEIGQITSDLLGGDEAKQGAAVDKIKNLGSNIADTFADKVEKYAPAIGEEIAHGVLKGVVGFGGFVGKRLGKRAAAKVNTQRESTRGSFIGEQFPFLANLISGGDLGKKIETDRILLEINANLKALKDPEGG